MLLLYVVVVVVDKNLTRADFPWSNVWLKEFGNITYYFWFDSTTGLFFQQAAI